MTQNPQIDSGGTDSGALAMLSDPPPDSERVYQSTQEHDSAVKALRTVQRLRFESNLLLKKPPIPNKLSFKAKIQSALAQSRPCTPERLH